MTSRKSKAPRGTTKPHRLGAKRNQLSAEPDDYALWLISQRGRLDIDPTTVGSCGNVFSDLGLPHAEELAAKAELAVRINQLTGKLTRQRAAKRLGITERQVQELRDYELSGFGVDQLRRLFPE